MPLPQAAAYLDENLAAADRLLSIVEEAEPSQSANFVPDTIEWEKSTIASSLPSIWGKRLEDGVSALTINNLTFAFTNTNKL